MDLSNSLFSILTILDDLLWSYAGLMIILPIGIYFTIKSKFFQLYTLSNPKRYIKDLVHCEDVGQAGTHPLKLYFASVGGMVGLGNIVTVIATVSIGGPGSLLWLWVASLLGMLVKYSEIYLGIKYRVPNDHNGYDGGPMYYLKHAFNSKFLCILSSLLLCVYGVEVSQFLIITDTITDTFELNKYAVIFILLALVLLAAVGGVKRLANLCSVLMPPFMLIYMLLGTWVIYNNIHNLPEVLSTVWSSAFYGHAPIGGFAGSTMLLAIHYGISRAVYSGDIGIGYDSIIQSETRIDQPIKQARLSIFALFADSIICTISILIVLLTGLWHEAGLQPSDYVTMALSRYFPYVDVFLAVLFFLAGFTTIVGYLVVGQKCAKYISPKRGRILYILYAIFAFPFFSFFDQNQVILIMNVSGGMLMIINLPGVFKLRKEIQFK